jgi:hypothetical protein
MFIMATTENTFTHLTHEEARQMFLRAKAHQQQLEKEGKAMWEEEQRIKTG